MKNFDQPVHPNPEVARIIPACLAYENRVVGFAKWLNVLIVAACPPVPHDFVRKLEFILNCEVRVVPRSADVIAEALGEAYGHETPSNESEAAHGAWYWPDWHHFKPDGTLVIKISGWEASAHWSGAAEFGIGHQDFAFWSWVVTVPQYHRLVDEAEVPGIRRIWRRYLARRAKSQ
jgi:hypothetical protein